MYIKELFKKLDKNYEMKIFRRNFLKTSFSLLSILSITKFEFFFPYFNKIKLKKNKSFVWYLSHDD